MPGGGVILANGPLCGSLSSGTPHRDPQAVQIGEQVGTREPPLRHILSGQSRSHIAHVKNCTLLQTRKRTRLRMTRSGSSTPACSPNLVSCPVGAPEPQNDPAVWN